MVLTGGIGPVSLRASAAGTLGCSAKEATMSGATGREPSDHPPLPHRAQPVSGVALLAATPGAVAGIIVGVQFVQPADSFGRLLLIGGGGAAVGGFAAYFAVYAVQRLLGRRA